MKTTESAASRFARRFVACAPASLIAAVLACAPNAHASPVKDSTLLAALQHGGCIILMRHASSPDARPAARTAAPGNINLERQLDADGIAAARAMGAALKRLSIRIGDVMSSPTFRARETIRAAGLGSPRIMDQLGDGGHSMSRSAIAGWSAWLRHAVGQQPPAGSNRLIVTQGPNISDAYRRIASGLKAGGALIFRPDGHGNAQLLGSMQIADWPQLAGQFSH
ncbi:MAG TPA: histidine phosphatase family protein [Steroidobacteraceae bacterium]|nr:histidine phosphatase family protein [Steroidobacteraceae bacterium]